jgi:hypothetical protein
MQSFDVLKQVVHIVSTGLEGDNNGRMKVKTLEWLEVVA